MARHRRTRRITGAALAAATLIGGGVYLSTGSDPASAAIAESAASCKLRATDANLSEGFGSQSGLVPSTGTVNAKMIFVDFPDAQANDDTTSLYDQLAPGATDWFSTASYGRLNLHISADTSRFYRMPDSSDSYGYQRGLSYESHQQYIQDAVRAAGRSVDFSGTQILYIVPTRRASAISFSPTFMGSVTTADGTVIDKTVTLGQDLWAWGSGVMNHETGHAMGLPDLYSLGSGDAHGYVGGWDMMGLISGPDPDRFGWHKWKQQWIDDNQVGCVTGQGGKTVTLTPLETNGGKKIAVVRTGSTRAVVAEVRGKQGVDGGACKTGVLIYTVDTTVNSGDGPVRVQDARPDSGGCGGHELNDATFGYGGDAVTHYRDAESGATIDVTGHSGGNYTLTIRK
ncbi:M6 family metalloprotease domain-containing protein [Kitasatospora sp. NPDC047058]|uniref:M6 family metalloprotease domain-containing protein n=1 Tax=Kitasatospora sp. NPDC047058 TaxID=3155620 RepID=UPI0033F66655